MITTSEHQKSSTYEIKRCIQARFVPLSYLDSFPKLGAKLRRLFVKTASRGRREEPRSSA
jgi:hypothetical protein